MSNPMAQSEPVEQRFAVPASNEAVEGAAATRQIDGTDVIEQGTLLHDNVLEALKDVIDPELGTRTSSTWALCRSSLSVLRTRCVLT